METGVRSRLPAIGVAAAVGAAWGLLGYALLWGHTPFVVHRPFVVSLAGTILLLPVRVVLWGIRAAERSAGHAFDFSQRNAWIGALAGAVGAALAVGATAAVVALSRRVRRRG